MAMLGAYCDNGPNIPEHSSFVARVGSVAVYACTWAGENPCSSDEITESLELINDNCNNLRSGDVWLGDWAKIYGRGSAWSSFCENA